MKFNLDSCINKFTLLGTSLRDAYLETFTTKSGRNSEACNLIIQTADMSGAKPYYTHHYISCYDLSIKHALKIKKGDVVLVEGKLRHINKGNNIFVHELSAKNIRVVCSESHSEEETEIHIDGFDPYEELDGLFNR